MADDALIIVRIRYRQLGGHMHCRVFTGTSFDGTFAKIGDLVVRVDEWPSFVALMNGCVQFKHEDEL